MTSRRSNGNRASPRGWAGCSTGWTCTSTRWWRSPFVAQLLAVDVRDDRACRDKSSWIQAAFLVGWALGGGFFGRIGDRLGRSRALMLTILTYALFTGLSFFAADVVAPADLPLSGGAGHRRRMGGRGVAAVGNLAAPVAALDRRRAANRRQPRRPAGDAGRLLAAAGRSVRSATCSWSASCRRCWSSGFAARCRSRRNGRRPGSSADSRHPSMRELFRGPVRRITLADDPRAAPSSLTAHWAFMFWYPQHLRNLPDVADWTRRRKRAGSSASA